MSDAARPALTTWSEDEQAFRMAIREFAESEIKPKVHEMDKNQQMDPSVISQLFQMGLISML